MSPVIIDVRFPPELLEALHDLASAYRTMAAATEARVPASAPESEAAPVEATKAETAVQPEPSPLPVAEGAAEASAPTMSDYLTAERRALLKAEYPAGVHVSGILARFNALDGPAVRDAQSLSLLANSMKLRRPPGFHSPSAPMTLAEVKAAERTVPATHYVAPVPLPAPVATPAPPRQPATRAAVMERVAAIRPGPGAGERREADFEQVRAWAAARGIQFATWDDLPRVNDRADRLGLAGFKRKLPGRSVHRAGGAA